jgi:hypothetical protein
MALIVSAIRCTLIAMPSDDELSAIQALNESEDRSRSPIQKAAKDAIALIGVVLPPAGLFLGVIANALDRREASNRVELVSALAAQFPRLKRTHREKRGTLEVLHS